MGMKSRGGDKLRIGSMRNCHAAGYCRHLKHRIAGASEKLIGQSFPVEFLENFTETSAASGCRSLLVNIRVV